jgi:hypothetical protein
MAGRSIQYQGTELAVAFRRTSKWGGVALGSEMRQPKTLMPGGQIRSSLGEYAKPRSAQPTQPISVLHLATHARQYRFRDWIVLRVVRFVDSLTVSNATAQPRLFTARVHVETRAACM